MQSNKKIANPSFCEEAGEYLEAAGYLRADQKVINDTIYFLRGALCVSVYGDNADFLIRHDAEKNQRNTEYVRFGSYSGISKFEIFDWMLLFHITGIVTIQSFMHKVMREGVCFSMKDELSQLFSHFRVTDDKEALPLAY